MINLPRLTDRLLIPKASDLTLRPVCIAIDPEVGGGVHLRIEAIRQMPAPVP